MILTKNLPIRCLPSGAAGLVRVTVDQDSEGGTTYELRRPALEEAGIQLEKYLQSDPILKEPA